MVNNYKLLTRLLVGVLKHQAKRYLGEEVVSAIVEAGTEHLGDRLLEILNGEAASRDHAKRISNAIKSAADELDLMLTNRAYRRIKDVPEEIVENVVEALTNLETGDLFGRRLQSAIQDLVASSGGEIDADNSLRISMQLYQAVLMAVLTIPELQPRAQDLLNQSRMWLLSEQIRKIELMNQYRQQVAIHTPTEKALLNGTIEQAIDQVRADKSSKGVSTTEDGIAVGKVVANGTIEIVKLIGQGGQGAVWKGRRMDTGDFVAIKVLNKDLIDRPEIVRNFKREAEILQSFSGNEVPDLVQSVVFEEGQYFYIVNYIEEGKTLDQVIQSSDIPVAKKVKTLCDAAEALHKMHQQGFIHGDVKPQNIIVGNNDRPVTFIDFGSARRIGEHDSNEPITFTYAYAAPELLALNYPKSAESQTSRVKVYMNKVGPYLDIYSLGIMLFQSLDPGLGKIARKEEYGLIKQLMVSNSLKAVIRKAIARNPDDRFKSALEFKTAIEESIRSDSTEDERAE